MYAKWVLLAAFVLLFSAEGSAVHGNEKYVYPLALTLSPSLEREREQIEQYFRDAQRRLKAFALTFRWEDRLDPPLITRGYVYDGKKQFDRGLRACCDLPRNRRIPKNCAAVAKNGLLLVLSPGACGRDDEDPAFYENILCHEMLHEFHLRLVDYREEAMGPLWFYEGFALYGSGQYESSLPELAEDEIEALVRSGKREHYRKYAALMRYFLRHVSLPEMVRRAGGPDFGNWLKEACTRLPNDW